MMASAHAALIAAVDSGEAIATADVEALLWLLAEGYAHREPGGPAWPTRRGRDYVIRHRGWVETGTPHRVDTS